MRFRRLALDQVNRATEVLESPAGKSVNVAQVLATLGKEVIATGFLGGDSGRFIGERLGTRTCLPCRHRQAFWPAATIAA